MELFLVIALEVGVLSVSLCHMLSALVGPTVENGHWSGYICVYVNLRIQYTCVELGSCEGKVRREPTFVRVSHSSGQSKLPIFIFPVSLAVRVKHHAPSDRQAFEHS